MPSNVATPAARIASRDILSMPSLRDVRNLPGDPRFEGVQTPAVVIHKQAPREVKVGRAATFVIDVKNTGTADASNVRVFDRVPEGMDLTSVTPTPTRGESGLLTWDLGTVPVGSQRQIKMQLTPKREGEMGSVAKVTFQATAGVRTVSTQPKLSIRQTVRPSYMIGSDIEIELEIANTGSGSASNVILQEDVPEGLQHPKGRQLDNALGTLRPNDVRRQVLRMKAIKAGKIKNTIRLVSADAETATSTVEVNVVAPDVAVELNGPGRRYLDRNATYN
ncbi:MAG: hypothetical protein AAFN70_21650, partial [Planctomycetota bacterium]